VCLHAPSNTNTAPCVSLILVSRATEAKAALYSAQAKRRKVDCFFCLPSACRDPVSDPGRSPATVEPTALRFGG
jgi:hypothetical protein